MVLRPYFIEHAFFSGTISVKVCSWINGKLLRVQFHQLRLPPPQNAGNQYYICNVSVKHQIEHSALFGASNRLRYQDELLGFFILLPKIRYVFNFFSENIPVVPIHRRSVVAIGFPINIVYILYTRGILLSEYWSIFANKLSALSV